MLAQRLLHRVVRLSRWLFATPTPTPCECLGGCRVVCMRAELGGLVWVCSDRGRGYRAGRVARPDQAPRLRDRHRRYVCVRVSIASGYRIGGVGVCVCVSIRIGGIPPSLLYSCTHPPLSPWLPVWPHATSTLPPFTNWHGCVRVCMCVCIMCVCIRCLPLLDRRHDLPPQEGAEGLKRRFPQGLRVSRRRLREQRIDHR